MDFLSRLRIRSKLGLMLGFFAAGLAASVAIDGSMLLQRMRDDRVDKLKAVVDTAVSVAAALNQQVAAQHMTPDQELARLREMLHAMRFDTGDGYLTAQTLQGVVLIHGTDPSRENKSGTAKDGNGRPIIALVQDALRNSDTGTVSYLFPKPGQSEPQPKVTYVALFQPLNAVFMAGAYTDDLARSFRSELVKSVSIGCALLLVLLGVAWLLDRDISGSLDRLKGAMARLARGDLAAEITGTGRQDEVGEMAAAVQVFKNDAIKMQELKAAREAEEQRAAEDKRQTMGRVANQFEASVGGIVGSVATAATEMETTAASMSATAERSAQQVTAVATASSQASENVQSVASAAEELASSVAEIGRHVASSSAIAAKAVGESERTNVMVGGLSAAAQKIGAVTSMISEIASRTNLLALNATIEAARAGDAGKGFAVVAAEVKNLANQTAKATDEISRHIVDMQKATGETVSAIQSIAATITQINEIATTIAAAVEQQGAATQEIARNIQQVAAGTEEVTQTIAAFSQGATENGTAAAHMLDAARMLSHQAAQLTREVGRFIADVKAA